MYNKIIILLCPLFLTACASPKYTATPIEAEHKSTAITIVKDDDTRAIFLDSMQEWCLDTAHKCTVVTDGTQPIPQELTLTYVSRWSWDFRTFIADAKVNAYKNNKKVGEVEFKAPNTATTTKFGDDSKRIESMMKILFGDQTVSEAQEKISTGEI